jgi:hypothetical protein
MPPTSSWEAREQAMVRPSKERHLREVEAIQVHHFVPRGDEVVNELLLRIGAAIDLGEGAQLGVRTENEVSAGEGAGVNNYGRLCS